MRLKCGFLLIFLVLAACAGEESGDTNQTTAYESSDGSQLSIDWIGTYRGVIPCADCSGINVVLKLKKDGTYAMTSSYLDHDLTLSEAGTYQWISKGPEMVLKADDGNQIKTFIGENYIELYYQNHEESNRLMREQYRLSKD